MADEPKQENRHAPNNENKFRPRRLIGFAIVGAILVVLVLWMWVKPSDPTEKKDFIQAVGVLIAGLAGFMGLYFTWTNQDQTRQTTQRTLELTQQGQIAERFTQAIDQLGATDDDRILRQDIRLGGIYALERIARDSPERDHSSVMAVLTAYVRENSLRPPPPPPFDPHHPTADIQATLDVLSRAQTRVPEEYRTRLDLRGANLQGANLQGTYLQGANLQEANLQEANLQGANLQGANLQGAYLQSPVPQEPYLERANLQGANLQGANLQGAHVAKEQLADTQSLQGATLPEG
jgi:hypothetical protein